MTDGYLDFSSNGTDSIPKTARRRGRRTACRHARRKLLVWSVAINEGFPAGEAASALRALWLGFETCVSAAAAAAGHFSSPARTRKLSLSLVSFPRPRF